MEELEIAAADARAITGFPDLIGHDPFDRLLLAQAAANGMTFLTADRALPGLGLECVVSARM
ncbi:hypothetical protein [Arthrobacter sp. A5]|uniref:hypothetical protein n=1 Tax=Arthrobacter sp. A5 TaxID=576926 RepID=UPI003DA822FB